MHFVFTMYRVVESQFDLRTRRLRVNKGPFHPSLAFVNEWSKVMGGSGLTTSMHIESLKGGHTRVLTAQEVEDLLFQEALGQMA